MKAFMQDLIDSLMHAVVLCLLGIASAIVQKKLEEIHQSMRHAQRDLSVLHPEHRAYVN